jgi:hypothetical protein
MAGRGDLRVRRGVPARAARGADHHDGVEPAFLPDASRPTAR